MYWLPLLFLVPSADPMAGDTWPGFRGNGSSRTAARNLPLCWSPTDGLAWKVGLPGYGQSSPVVWRDRVFVTAVEGTAKEKCIVLALRADTGGILWRKEFSASQKGKNNPMMSRAAPTPVADASGVYAFFESSDLIGLSHDGDIKWRRALSREYGELKNHHGLGGSLAQTDKAVFVLVDHSGPSYLLAVEKATGNDLWKTERKSCLSWTSPVVTRYKGRTLVLASGSGSLTCYDAATGKELWHFDGLFSNDIPSPAVGDGLIFVAAGENPLKPNLRASAKYNCCLRLTRSGDKPSYELLWHHKKPLAYHASPLIHQGHVYILTRSGVLHCLDARTGEKRYAERLDNPCWATPLAAGDRLFCFGTDGITTVIVSGPKFVKVASNRLWSADDFRARKEAEKKKAENQLSLPAPPSGNTKERKPSASREQMQEMLDEAVGDVVYGVAAVNGAFYVRTGTGLYCIRGSR